ncbi:MAG TPA: D-glycero-beta-D-manno-heptose 1-phosphate adenylyltransferase [Puia sp.]|jgi:D-beta-D-heptose 7-phosphate kinase/D-beta-D-heptose 1-phosphate adenosyltransferase|nr:D-glycero-beta-D-manno-heptose 1-phosphate adenylyltransferase [Puia sp.]
MKVPQIIQQKIFDLPALQHQLRRWRLLGKSVAFTNGCFDILHEGHIASLSDAAREADILIVGVNSDDSTCRLKGPQRPINPQQARATVLASLLMVDAVVIFEEDTPLELIKIVQPDVLVKGGDYTLDQIVGAKEVMAAGGRVVINPIVPGFSTTGLIEKITKL